MEKQTETEQRIRVGRTEMDFQHQGRTLTAVHPFYGPANSLTLLKQIRSSPNIREPTASQVASFVNEYFNGEEPQAQEVTDIMRHKYFRGFTGIIYVPETKGKGLAHFIDYPEFDKNSVVSRDNLIARLSESRAQVSFEHMREGTVEWKNVAKHHYFIAWAGGEEGAEKLAELASKHSAKEAYIWVPDVSNLTESIARVATLNSIWDSDRLYVNSYNQGNYDNGYAFGVCAPEKSE